MAGAGDGGATLQAADYIIAIGSMVAGGIVTLATRAWLRGKSEGTLETRVDALEEAHDKHVETTRAEIARIEDRAAVAREQIAGIKEQMAAVATALAALSQTVQTGFSAITARIDNAFRPRD